MSYEEGWKFAAAARSESLAAAGLTFTCAGVAPVQSTSATVIRARSIEVCPTRQTLGGYGKNKLLLCYTATLDSKIREQLITNGHRTADNRDSGCCFWQRACVAWTAFSLRGRPRPFVAAREGLSCRPERTHPATGKQCQTPRARRST